ncbi:Cdc40 protein [Saccharomycopsis crataegensis]|uniref:Pre-mRNA-processing factor 17 n=1 Tax=Saccharomycopsis crataegensis TaxID=43959 RepID=A0AAV5QTP8_9ASCO|nr:Cdc40 protein [Saccharomycopsis crataegensis]
MNSIVAGYSSSEDESDNELKLRDPLEHSELIKLVSKNINKHEKLKEYPKDDFTNKRRALNATIEPQSYDNAVFELNSRSYLIDGYAEGPDDKQIVVNDAILPNKRQKLGITKKKKSIWEAPSESEEFTDDENGSDESEDEEKKQDHGPMESDVAEIQVSNTKFFGKSETDYLGRTYMHVPQDLKINLLKDPGSQECFIPKKQIFTWDGHAGGVTKLQFIPRSGHLLLSGGNDCNIHLYDTFHNRPLLRGYYGHRRPIKDLNFNTANVGKTFASCGFDRVVNVWDTEVGKIVTSLKMKGAIPNTLQFNPNNENELLVGLSNNKIEHYDLRIPSSNSDHIIQTYDHHLNAINSLTFISEGKRFLSTSDDRSIRVWELGINIPIKYIADPTQFSMPRSRIHPSGKYFSTQAMNNKIMVYQAHEKFKQNKKKVFEGHDVAGYGIDFTFSPDGKIVMSGGSTGKAYFWDWKTTKMLKSFQVDKTTISCIESHPQETSKVAMAGSSGKIFYWE